MIDDNTLRRIANSDEWDTDILFRCIWGNTAWQNCLAESLGKDIRLPPFKPVMDNLASKINTLRQLQSHAEAGDPKDAHGLIHCRLAVVELLDVLLGEEIGDGLISNKGDFDGIRDACIAIAKMEADTAVKAGVSVSLDERQIISLMKQLAIREFSNTPKDERLLNAMDADQEARGKKQDRSMEGVANFVAYQLRAITKGNEQVCTIPF